MIEVRFKAPGGRDGDDASLALGEVELLPSESATEAGSDVGEDGAVPVEDSGGSGDGSDGEPTIAPTSGG